MNNNKEQLENTDYSMPFLKSKRFLIILTSTFVVTFISGLTLPEGILSRFDSPIQINRNCHISFQEKSFKWFLPRVEINKIKIDQGCSPSLKKSLKIPKLDLYIRGLAFSPFGLHFKVETEVYNNPISVYTTFGFNQIALRISDNQIKLQNLQELIPMVRLSGDVKLDALLTLEDMQIDTLLVNARSNNLRIPAQNIMMLNVESMNLGNLKLILDNTTSKKKITVKDFVVGKTGAAVEMNFKGDIQLNQRNPRFSGLNLGGEIKISEDMQKKYALIKMYLDSYDKKDDYYQIQVNGTLASPQLKSRR